MDSLLVDPTKVTLSRNPFERVRVFVDRGLIPTLPTTWQLVQGQIEMGAYVALPDEGDRERYADALFGHPLLRTPIILAEIGYDHTRIGHGLHAKAESVFRHLNFVFHDGMPEFDLQLLQTMPNGIEAFRAYTRAIEDASSNKARKQRNRIDLILPRASEYRRKFLEPGGWLDRAAAFDYPSADEVTNFLRPEFTSLVRFMNHCATAYPSFDLSEVVYAPLRVVRLAARAPREWIGTKLRTM